VFASPPRIFTPAGLWIWIMLIIHDLHQDSVSDRFFRPRRVPLGEAPFPSGLSTVLTEVVPGRPQPIRHKVTRRLTSKALRVALRHNVIYRYSRSIYLRFSHCFGAGCYFGSPLSVLGTPVKVGVHCLFCRWSSSSPRLGAVGPVVRGQGGAPAAQRGRTTLMPGGGSTAC
jgi:hypothetical protein